MSHNKTSATSYSDLKNDYNKAKSKLEALANKEVPNYLVTEKNYLSPGFDISRIVDINHPDGMYKYIASVYNGIHCAITMGTLPTELVPVNAPDYLKKFIEI